MILPLSPVCVKLSNYIIIKLYPNSAWGNELFIQANLVVSNEPFDVVWLKGGENVSEFRDARVWVIILFWFW